MASLPPTWRQWHPLRAAVHVRRETPDCEAGHALEGFTVHSKSLWRSLHVSLRAKYPSVVTISPTRIKGRGLAFVEETGLGLNFERTNWQSLGSQLVGLCTPLFACDLYTCCSLGRGHSVGERVQGLEGRQTWIQVPVPTLPFPNFTDKAQRVSHPQWEDKIQ